MSSIWTESQQLSTGIEWLLSLNKTTRLIQSPGLSGAFYKSLGNLISWRHFRGIFDTKNVFRLKWGRKCLQDGLCCALMLKSWQSPRRDWVVYRSCASFLRLESIKNCITTYGVNVEAFKANNLLILTLKYLREKFKGDLSLKTGQKWWAICLLRKKPQECNSRKCWWLKVYITRFLELKSGLEKPIFMCCLNRISEWIKIYFFEYSEFSHF